MKKKLTEMAVDKMNPEAGKRLEVFDTLTPGLALRITEAGKKSWSVMYRVAGRGDGGNQSPEGRAHFTALAASWNYSPEGRAAQAKARIAAASPEARAKAGATKRLRREQDGRVVP